MLITTRGVKKDKKNISTLVNDAIRITLGDSMIRSTEYVVDNERFTILRTEREDVPKIWAAITMWVKGDMSLDVTKIISSPLSAVVTANEHRNTSLS